MFVAVLLIAATTQLPRQRRHIKLASQPSEQVPWCSEESFFSCAHPRLLAEHLYKSAVVRRMRSPLLHLSVCFGVVSCRLGHEKHDLIGSLTLREVLPLAECIAKNAGSGSWAESMMLLPLQLEAAGYRPGVFLEIGALDGISGSQTLILEKCFGWNGVLIEASPKNFEKLERSGRNATKVHAAGCKNGDMVRMSNAGNSIDAALDLVSKEYLAKWGRHMNMSHSVSVPCKELRDILYDAAYERVDFMSVDVQGSELQVLQTVDPKVLNLVLVEAEGTSQQKNEHVRRLLKGYGLVQLPFPKPRGYGHLCSGCNDLFARPDLRDIRNITHSVMQSGGKEATALQKLLTIVAAERGA